MKRLDRVWNQKKLRTSTKTRIYSICVLPDSQTIFQQTRFFVPAAKSKKAIGRHWAGDILEVDLPSLGSTRLVGTRESR